MVTHMPLAAGVGPRVLYGAFWCFLVSPFDKTVDGNSQKVATQVEGEGFGLH